MTALDRRTHTNTGRYAQRKGKDAEQDFARYLTAWWPDAKRWVRTGWKVGDRVSRDCGDIDGTPHLAWQVKHLADDFSDTKVRELLRATEEQAVTAAADLGILIQRRAGKAHPGDWYAWLWASDLHALLDRKYHPEVLLVGEPPAMTTPVRLLVADLVALLTAAGYGAPPP